MTYHRLFNKSNTTGATCGAGTVYPFRAQQPPVFSVARVTRSLVFMCNVLLIVVNCPFVSFFWPLCCLSFFSFGHCVVCPFFLFAIVLSVLFFFLPLCCLSFDLRLLIIYPFGIFKLVLIDLKKKCIMRVYFIMPRNVDTFNRQIHDRSFFWLGTDTSVKSGALN